MPTPPELADRRGNVWVIEIFGIVNSYNFTHAYSHIRICRKINVDLQGEGKHAYPKRKRAL